MKKLYPNTTAPKQNASRAKQLNVGNLKTVKTGTKTEVLKPKLTVQSTNHAFAGSKPSALAENLSKVENRTDESLLNPRLAEMTNTSPLFSSIRMYEKKTSFHAN